MKKILFIILISFLSSCADTIKNSYEVVSIKSVGKNKWEYTLKRECIKAVSIRVKVVDSDYKWKIGDRLELRKEHDESKFD